jgi:endonuclease/exonuclease/phosphatase (EEP) superfamily protein YafD
MEIFFQVLSILCITFTAIALIERKAWWIRILDFPRLQILVILLIAICGLLFFLTESWWVNGILSSLGLIAALIQVSYIYPYFIFAKKAVPDAEPGKGKKLSLLIANVRMKNRDSEKLVKLIKKHKPDIFVAIETNQWWEDALQPATANYPYKITYPMDNTYGMLLYSQLPLRNESIEFLVKNDIPSFHTDAVLDEHLIKLTCVHPEPPAPEEADTSAPRDRELLIVAQNIKNEPGPCIVLGDLNDVAWSRTSYKFEQMSQLNDPRRGRGFYNTYHAQIPLMKWALDHVFLSRHFRLKQLQRLPEIGSDHFPVYIVCTI